MAIRPHLLLPTATAAALLAACTGQLRSGGHDDPADGGSAGVDGGDAAGECAPPATTSLDGGECVAPANTTSLRGINWHGLGHFWGGGQGSDWCPGFDMSDPAACNLSGIETDLADMQRLGVGWIRIALVQPAGAPSDHDAFYDLVFAQFAARGWFPRLDAILVKTGATGYRASGTEEDAARTDAWVAHVVQRYGGRIRHWELDNEPNLGWSGIGSCDPAGCPAGLAEAYLQTASRMAGVIRRTDPTATILLAGLSEYGAEPFVAALESAAAPASSFVDVVPLHLFRTDRGTEAERGAAIRGALAATPLGDLPVWVNETGTWASGWGRTSCEGMWAGCMFGQSEEARAEALAASLSALHEQAPDQPVFWYDLHETWEGNESYPEDGIGYGCVETDHAAVPTFHYLPCFDRLAGLAW